MKKQSFEDNEPNMITLFKPFKFLIVLGLFISASVLLSCDATDINKTSSKKVPLSSYLNEPQQITLIPRKDSLMPPKVNKIADAKAAKKIKVGKPFVTKNPNENNLGFPFFKQYKKEDGLAFNTAHTLVEDNEGYLWIGTNEGLSRFDGNQFLNFSFLNGANSNSFSSSLVKDKYGRLWMYNSDGWLELFDGVKFIGFKFLGGERLNWVLDILSDKSGNLWFATDNGLLKLEGIENIEEVKVTRYLEKDGLIDNFINCLDEDAMGNIWIGTVNGISNFDGQTFINYSKDNALFSNLINDIHTDKWNQRTRKKVLYNIWKSKGRLMY